MMEEGNKSYEDEKTGLLVDDASRSSDANSKSQEKSASTVSTAKGISALLLTAVFTAASRISVQMLEKAVPDFELNAIRCACALVCMSVYFVCVKSFPWIERGKIVSVFLVCFFNNVITIGLYVSVTLLPLATSSCIITTVIVGCSVVLFRIINKEKIQWDKMVAVPICILGVFLVLQPSFIFGDDKNDNVTGPTVGLNNQNTSVNITMVTKETGILTSTVLGYIVSAITGLCTILATSVTKYDIEFYTARNIFMALLWDYILGTILSVIIMLTLETPTIPQSINDWVLVMIHAATYIFICPLLLYGGLRVSGSLGAILNSNHLLLSLLAQYTILKDIFPGHRNWMEVAGVLLVLGGTIFSSLVEIICN